MGIKLYLAVDVKRKCDKVKLGYLIKIAFYEISEIQLNNGIFLVTIQPMQIFFFIFILSDKICPFLVSEGPEKKYLQKLCY